MVLLINRAVRRLQCRAVVRSGRGGGGRGAAAVPRHGSHGAADDDDDDDGGRHARNEHIA